MGRGNDIIDFEFYVGQMLPQNLLSEELAGLYGTRVIAEFAELIKFYRIYELGADFEPEGSNNDYIPADLNYKEISRIINKEARFLFGKAPDFYVSVGDKDNKEDKKNATILQNLVNNVLSKNLFSSKLVKAAKDCFIARRVAYILNFDEIAKTIKISFIPSLEFVFETADDDIDELKKLVIFYQINDMKDKADQRIYKKKYWLDNGVCYINEKIYDGFGNEIEVLTDDKATRFSYIPGGVIINDGLTGDISGESEVENLSDYEKWYSRLSNADMDSERKNMNPIKWARDMSPDSTDGLSTAAGAFWDLDSDDNRDIQRSGEVGILESAMNYSSPLSNTLSRIKNGMLEQVDMPDTSSESLKGIITSGKTLKAIYWGLIARCEEKMLAWRPALENIARIIIDGAIKYPLAAQGYSLDNIPDVYFSVKVENNYLLPEDETEEKNNDLAEVSSEVMSKKSYMKKWRNLTDEEADAELRQIALERQILEDSYSIPPEDFTV